jgi:hypothetical protein
MKYLSKNRPSELVEYLVDVLKKRVDPDDPKFKPQRILLTTWITELKLSLIHNIQMKMQAQLVEQTKNNGGEIDDEFKRLIMQPAAKAKQDLYDLLKQNKENLHVDTIFQVLQMHGKIEECI